MYALARPRFRRSQYLVLERNASMKHEFVDGQILAMAGAKPRHNAVAANAARSLGNRLGERCAVLSSDQRVTIEATGDSFYPDVVVVCGDWALDEDGHGVTNPTAVIEVASPGTAEYDRLEKLPQYKLVASCVDVILVDPRSRTIEHHRRLETGQWLVTALDAAGDLDLGLGATVPAAELFAGLDRIPDVD